MRSLTICGRNIADFNLVLNSTPAPAEQTAAEFLQRVISVSCGVTLPISNHGSYSICIGTRESSHEVKWDGFRITTDERNVYLDGNIPRGTLYAAYDFAETYLGYRKFAPDCEVIPTEGESDVPENLNHIENPAFENRRSDWSEFNRCHDFASHCRINAMVGHTLEDALGGIGSPFVAHTFWEWLPGTVHFREHPEYYALVDGARIPCNDGAGPGQPCLTHPDVLHIMTDNILRYLRENPGVSLVDVSQCDNVNYCRCERCAAVDEEEGSHCGTILRLVNAIAEAVEQEFPHVMLQTFAYEYSTTPPRITKARHNVLIRYCTMAACFRHAIDDPDCPINRKTIYPEMIGWQERSEHMTVWDYVTNYHCFPAPFPHIRSLRENARFFAQCHARNVFEEDNPWAPEGGVFCELKAYLIGKLLWNAHMDETEYDRCINEFLAAYYGTGWRELRRYLDLEHEVTADRCIGCMEDIDIGYMNYMSEPQVKRLKRYLHDNFEPGPFLPMLPNHPLTGLVARMEEAQACFDRALAMAETETEKAHLTKSRMAVDYIDLFCSDKDEFAMSTEEKQHYLARVEQFHKDKVRYGFRWNLNTQSRRNR